MQAFNLEGQNGQITVLKRALGPQGGKQTRGVSLCEVSSEAVTSSRGWHFGQRWWPRKRESQEIMRKSNQQGLGDQQVEGFRETGSPPVF